MTVRVAESGIGAIKKLAEAENVDRSEMIRRLLAYAIRTMPKGWKP